MRTTLDIDDDVLNAAKDLARQQHQSAGQVVSRLLREVLTGQAGAAKTTDSVPGAAGFRPFSGKGRIVSNDQVNALREQEGI